MPPTHSLYVTKYTAAGARGSSVSDEPPSPARPPRTSHHYIKPPSIMLSWQTIVSLSFGVNHYRIIGRRSPASVGLRSPYLQPRLVPLNPTVRLPSHRHPDEPSFQILDHTRSTTCLPSVDRQQLWVYEFSNAHNTVFGSNSAAYDGTQRPPKSRNTNRVVR